MRPFRGGRVSATDSTSLLPVPLMALVTIIHGLVSRKVWRFLQIWKHLHESDSRRVADVVLNLRFARLCTTDFQLGVNTDTGKCLQFFKKCAALLGLQPRGKPGSA